jgi:hypothetical protein
LQAPVRLAADSAYGSAPTLDWLVNKKKIEPHIPVIDMERREDGIFAREDFSYDKERDVYTCPAGKVLTTTGRTGTTTCARTGPASAIAMSVH